MAELNLSLRGGVDGHEVNPEVPPQRYTLDLDCVRLPGDISMISGYSTALWPKFLYGSVEFPQHHMLQYFLNPSAEQFIRCVFVVQCEFQIACVSPFIV